MEYGKIRGSIFRSVSLMILFSLLGWIPPAPCHAQDLMKRITIHEAYELALKSHKGIMIAQGEIRKAELLKEKARSVMLPMISAEGSYSRRDEAVEVEPSIGDFQLDPYEVVPEEQWQANFEVLQPIYQGSYFPLKKQAKQSIETHEQSYNDVIQRTLFEVAKNYYEVLRQKELVDNAEEILNFAREALRVSKVKFEAGEVTEDVVVKSELSVTGAKSKLMQAGNNLTMAKDHLKSLVGLKSYAFDVEKPSPRMPIQEDYETLLQRALEDRHDYQAALKKIEYAKTDIDFTKTKFHPTLTASYDYYAVDEPAYNQDDNYWIAAVTLRIPIYERGVRFTELKEKLEILHQTELEAQELERIIRNEVQDAVLTIETGKSMLENFKKQVELAQKNYDITSTKFEFGSATSLELNQALAELDSASTEYITRSYDQQIFMLNLERAVGLFGTEYLRNNG